MPTTEIIPLTAAAEQQPAYGLLEDVLAEQAHASVEVLPHDPETYMTGLNEPDRKAVEQAVGQNIREYRQHTHDIQKRERVIRERPGRIGLIAERFADRAVDAVKQKAEGYSQNKADSTLPYANRVQEVQEVQKALDAVRSGTPLSQLPLAEMQVVVPKWTLPGKKRAVAEEMLGGRQAQAQGTVLRELGMEPGSQTAYDMAVKALAGELVTTEVENYALKGEGKMPVPDIELADSRLPVMAAIGRLDKAELTQRLKAEITHRLEREAHRRGPTLPELGVVTAYEDATLAGHMARKEVTATGLDNELLVAYEALGLAMGMTEEDLHAKAVQLKVHWKQRSRQAEERFTHSILRGDTILEHYTPLSLDSVKSGGLFPKTVHGHTAINPRSIHVHFTSANHARRDGAIDYTMYARLSPYVIGAMRKSADVRPVSGMFALSLVEVVESGLNGAAFSTKSVDGGNEVEDIVLVGAGGEPAHFGAENLDLVVSGFEGQPPVPQLPYDAAIDKKLEAIRTIHRQLRGAKSWPELIAEHLNTIDIARTVLKDEGVDAAWVDVHVFGDIEAVRAKHARPENARAVVPLTRLKGSDSLTWEHIDGDSGRMQRACLGVVQLH
ncbi:MAG TPA: hypothetical protein VJ836_06745 [Candidatus Saccharimonadales bacterium]|nr:hypothetical protein [Candidatus Saccharimonadales bacterium]